jgi:hypothetical protein
MVPPSLLRVWGANRKPTELTTSFGPYFNDTIHTDDTEMASVPLRETPA